MALSNTTHGAPGKAHGAGKSSIVTGLEFLTAEGGDAAALAGKDGVDFSALMQGIIQPLAKTPTAPKAADAAPLPEAMGSEQAPLPVVPSLSQSAIVTPEDDAPTQASALLALALGNAKQAAPTATPPSPNPEEARDTQSGEPEVAAPKDPHLVVATAGKVISRRVAALEANVLGRSDGEGDPAEPKSVKEGERPSSDVSVTLTQVAPSAVTDAAPGQAPLVLPVVQAQGATADQKGAERMSGKDKRSRAEGIGADASASTRALPRTGTLTDKAVLQATDSAAQKNIVTSPAGDEPRAPGLEVRPFASEVEKQVSKLTDNKKTGKSEITRRGLIPVDADMDAAPVLESRERDNIAIATSASAPTARADAVITSVSQVTASQIAPTVASPLSAPASLSGTLGQQVVDMGISGQWIDDIARQIASISANPGHGSFRIASQELGAVQVDIAPAAIGSGSDIVMRVDSDAAFAALNDDKERLMQDARLASVRIGELRIDRLAAPQESARGDMNGNAQQQQNQAGQQQGNPSSLSQNGAQMNDRGGQQQGRPDAASLAGQHQGGNSPKAPFTTTVMRGADADEATGPMRSGRGDSARYA